MRNKIRNTGNTLRGLTPGRKQKNQQRVREQHKFQYQLNKRGDVGQVWGGIRLEHR